MRTLTGRLSHAAATACLSLSLLLSASSCDDGTLNSVFLICPALDLVFVLDTSGSMGDEGEALCENIADIQELLEAEGVEVNVTLLGITEDGDDDARFSCLTDNVLDLLGSSVPGVDDDIDDTEDWGPAVAVVADRFPWQEGALRIIVPISDEDPQDGDATSSSGTGECDDPGADRDAIDNAIVQANNNDVIVSPISADQDSFDDEEKAILACVEPLMNSLADATGGEVNSSENASDDLAGAILSLIEAACVQATE